MTKADHLLKAITDEWASIADLMFATGWQAHSVRGALSTIAKKRGVKILRKRDQGMTYYRADSGDDA
jgi:hypothetical protein